MHSRKNSVHQTPRLFTRGGAKNFAEELLKSQATQEVLSGRPVDKKRRDAMKEAKKHRRTKSHMNWNYQSLVLTNFLFSDAPRSSFSTAHESRNRISQRC